MATINYKGLQLCWDRFLVEGEVLFKYMKDNFNDMLDGDDKIKHFDIRDEICYDYGSQELKQLYDIELQKRLVPWIKKEFEENRLFDKTLWRPFRDVYTITDMYLGYRKLFPFRPDYETYPELLENTILRPETNIKGTYYFQLTIDAECDEETCSDCINDTYNHSNNIMKGYNKHFEIVLYNWFDEKTNKLYFEKFGPILSDNLITKQYWETF